MKAVELAPALAARFSEVVPDGFTTLADGDVIWFAHESVLRSGTFACRVLNDDAGRLVEACWLALDDLQGFLAEATTEPWPGRWPEVRTVPARGAALQGGEVGLWYGDATNPILRLRSLPSDPELFE